MLDAQLGSLPMRLHMGCFYQYRSRVVPCRNKNDVGESVQEIGAKWLGRSLDSGAFTVKSL